MYPDTNYRKRFLEDDWISDISVQALKDLYSVLFLVYVFVQLGYTLATCVGTICTCILTSQSVYMYMYIAHVN